MLHDCSSLVSLPHFISRAHEAGAIPLNGCVSLAALPETIGMLAALEELYLDGVRSSKNYRAPSGNLAPCIRLSLFDCSNLVALPKIGGLTALKTLNLSECQVSLALPKMPVPTAPGVDVRNISYVGD